MSKENSISTELSHLGAAVDLVAQVQPSLREHYAGLAMQGILANSYHDLRNLKGVPAEAFEMADAMIAELSKANQQG